MEQRENLIAKDLLTRRGGREVNLDKDAHRKWIAKFSVDNPVKCMQELATAFKQDLAARERVIQVLLISNPIPIPNPNPTLALTLTLTPTLTQILNARPQAIMGTRLYTQCQC